MTGDLVQLSLSIAHEVLRWPDPRHHTMSKSLHWPRVDWFLSGDGMVVVKKHLQRGHSDRPPMDIHTRPSPHGWTACVYCGEKLLSQETAETEPIAVARAALHAVRVVSQQPNGDQYGTE